MDYKLFFQPMVWTQSHHFLKMISSFEERFTISLIEASYLCLKQVIWFLNSVILFGGKYWTRNVMTFIVTRFLWGNSYKFRRILTKNKAKVWRNKNKIQDKKEKLLVKFVKKKEENVWFVTRFLASAMHPIAAQWVLLAYTIFVIYA